VPYPDKYLTEDEDVVRRFHPHWSTLVVPVAVLLVVVGGASFGAALVQVGPDQGLIRLGIVVVAAGVLVPAVAVPVLRWRTTQYVVTTHRLLFREGVLARRGRDVGFSRITDVAYEQTLWQRVIRSGTVVVETAGDGAPTVLRDVPDSHGVSQLLSHLVDEDVERRLDQPHGRGWAVTQVADSDWHY